MRVGVIGASGYTGGELLRILAMHEACEISCATSRKYAGERIHKVHPHLREILDMRFENLAPEDVATRSDVVFTALPHGVPMKIVPVLLEHGVKVVDLSGDFRFKSISTYEKYYQLKHEHPEIKAIYGLPELYREKIKKAEVVANPGCYPTSIILGVAPLIKERIIDVGKIIADSKSGASGGGAQPKPVLHFCMVEENILPYKVSSHRHLPEIEERLREFDERVSVSFVPHLVPVIRGIETTIHCFLIEDVEGEEIKKIYEKFYEGEPFVRVLNHREMPRMSSVRGTNYIDIGCFEVDKERERAIVVSVIDNLVKGASGQAVQNMNIMLGFKEDMGLRSIGVHP
ncbi:MAG: N-acetyl-gamma-glutamyl-phosphate reductase [Candidatus Hydrothermarchaeota archaeon]|nr:MAG: N-acetyl-gamma-glutamyl-phosphate reductase [Candidatus Hydrothermarchaeota archaeon]